METKTLQEQINKFYKETGYQLEVKDGKAYYNDDLDLYGAKITELPDNLVVGGYLNLNNSEITKLPDYLVVGGNFYLYNTKITKLPDSLVVGGYLNLYGAKITKLPDNLVVGGSLYLSYANITKLPDNLVVGGCLDLEYTKIDELPDNLMAGGSLYIRDTKITKLPNNLIVGGDLSLYGTNVPGLPDNLVIGGYIWGMSNTPFRQPLTKEAEEKSQKIRNFSQWTIGNKSYIKADGIFSVVDSHRGNVWRTHRIGEDETLYVVTDGEGHYAHGNTLKEAKDDLIYKINDRDTSLYENLSLDDEVSFEEAIAMYRTVTGACVAGTRDFIENRLPKPHKEKYTIREDIELTDGEYGSEKLKKFFKV